MKIFKLRLEYYMRYFGFVFGIAFSALSLFLIFNILYIFFSINSTSAKKWFEEIATNGFILETLILFSTLITTITVTIFILVATRKFKEINQLIKDKKEEINN